MSATPFTAAQLNACMHEHHADTVADLAQRGLAMEFMDAKPGRPTVLRISSAKAFFGFHLPVHESLQYLADMASMMESARNAAPGFRKVFHSNDGRAKSLNKMVTFAKNGKMLYTDQRGWQLQFFSDDCWVDGFHPRRFAVAFSIDDVFLDWVEEMKMLDFMRSAIDVPTLVKDASKCTILATPLNMSSIRGTTSIFSIAPIGNEKSKYFISIDGLKNSGGEFLIGCAMLIAQGDNPSMEPRHFIRPSSTFWIYGSSKPVFFIPRLELSEIVTLTFEPEAFGISKETLAMMVELNIPIAHEISRFKQATESFDIDFSEVLAAEEGQSLF